MKDSYAIIMMFLSTFGIVFILSVTGYNLLATVHMIDIMWALVAFCGIGLLDSIHKRLIELNEKGDALVQMYINANKLQDS